MKRMIGILVLVLMFCWSGQVFARAANFGLSKAAVRLLNNFNKQYDIADRNAAKERKRSDLTEKRSDFYNYLDSTVGTAQPVADKETFPQEVAAYYKSRKDFKALQEWCDFAKTLTDVYNGIYDNPPIDKQTFAKRIDKLQQQYARYSIKNKNAAGPRAPQSTSYRNAGGPSQVSPESTYNRAGAVLSILYGQIKGVMENQDFGFDMVTLEEKSNARPKLDPSAAKKYLEETARDLGDKSIDNKYGSGTLRGVMAVRSAFLF